MTALTTPKAATINTSAHDGVGRLSPVSGRMVDASNEHTASWTTVTLRTSTVPANRPTSRIWTAMATVPSKVTSSPVPRCRPVAVTPASSSSPQKAQAMPAHPPALGARRVSAH
jgi:hypothetical protein